MIHCSACGEPLPAAPPSACAACGAEHWRNPKPCAGALVARDGRVMLVRRGIDPWRGAWDLPGGFCDADEHPADTARREVLEETGLAIEIAGLLGMWMDRYGDQEPPVSTLNLYFHARPVDGGAERLGSPEVVEIGWFSPEEIPEDLAFPEHAQLVLAAWCAAAATDRLA